MDPKVASKQISIEIGKHSIYSNAPELLMESIMELEKILIKVKTKSGETESYLAFKKILNAMNFSFHFMNDIAIIYKESYNLKVINSYLTELLRINANELDTYQAIEASMLNGTLEEKINVIKKKVEPNG